ncbi:MAG TPA: thioesterase family protein [Jatrophihabitans sp.]
MSDPFLSDADGDYFAVIEEHPGGGRYRADPATGGPWVPGLQHGGPPSALVIRAAERRAAHERSHGSDPLIALRAAVEFVGPVPVDEVTVATRVVRSARTAALVEATLTAQDRLCLQARVWLVRAADTSTVAAPLPPPAIVPTGLPDLGGNFPYHDTIEWQAIRGSMRTLGPGLVWARAHYRLIAEEPLGGLQRVALIGDSASGISAVLDWDEWSFLNIDLDVHLSRPVDGDWVLIDAVTTLGTAGSALTRSTVSDVRGEVGATAQTLVVARR